MVKFAKDWGMANLQLVIGRQGDDTGPPSDIIKLVDISAGETVVDHIGDIEQFLIAGLANFEINEKFRAGVMGYYWLTDEEWTFADDNEGRPFGKRGGDTTDTDLLTAGVYAGFRFTPSIELKGIYYFQDQGDTWSDVYSGGLDDSANAWKVIIDVDQDVLKFTSAWLEYGQIDNNFARFNTGTHVTFGGMGGQTANVAGNFDPQFVTYSNSTKLYGVHLDQEWNDKWRTFARYFVADYDTVDLDDTKNWSLGVAYRVNPAVEFELAYDSIDYGNSATNNESGIIGDDHMVRFRTFVTF
jgi:hypothetical protein